MHAGFGLLIWERWNWLMKSSAGKWRNSLVQYACRFWASHLGKVELVDEELSREMEKFTGIGMGIGKGCLLKWVMVISMIGGVHHAIRSLQGLLPWLVSIEVLRMKILLIEVVCRDHQSVKWVFPRF